MMMPTFRRTAFTSVATVLILALPSAARAADFVGTNGIDNFTGTNSADTFHMKAGGDTVQALDGNDYVDMNDGRDYAQGSGGADEMYGGSGGVLFDEDVLRGEAGNDRLFDTADSDDIDGTCGGEDNDYSNIYDGTAGGGDYFYGGQGTDSWSRNSHDIVEQDGGCIF